MKIAPSIAWPLGLAHVEVDQHPDKHDEAELDLQGRVAPHRGRARPLRRRSRSGRRSRSAFRIRSAAPPPAAARGPRRRASPARAPRRASAGRRRRRPSRSGGSRGPRSRRSYVRQGHACAVRYPRIWSDVAALEQGERPGGRDRTVDEDEQQRAHVRRRAVATVRDCVSSCPGSQRSPLVQRALTRSPRPAARTRCRA